MWKKWKKRLSSLLIITLIASLCVPQLSVIADTADVIVGDNGTIYDADYEPFIYDEDEWTDDSDDDEEEVAVLAYYDDATPSNATPSNASFASDSNWDLATDSNAMLNIVEFTEPGPFLPASGGISTFRLRRAAASEEADSVKGIHTAKTATANEDGSYTIQLESYVEGNITQTSTTTPVDIVLVLDVSGSMEYCIGCGKQISDRNNTHNIYEYREAGTAKYLSNGTYYHKNDSGVYEQVYYCQRCGGFYTKSHDKRHLVGEKIEDATMLYNRITIGSESCVSRIDALKDAVEEFVSSVTENAEENDVDHQIAIVKFAGEMSVEEGNTKSTQSYGDGSALCNHTQIVKNLTSVTQVNENTNATGEQELIKAVNELSPDGPTRTDYAMTKAEDVIAGIPENRTSQKVVIMFTDGEPSKWSEYSEDVANNSISKSYSLKNKGVTVYTIGVFDGADATVPMPNNASNVNRYMHYVSSNFPEATSLTSGGTSDYPSNGTSYYMSAGSTDSLSNIFSNISDQIQSGGASIELGTETVVEDVVTPYFELPEDVSGIEVYTSECTGADGNGDYTFSSDLKDVTDSVHVTLDDSTNAVSVYGFDYSSNFVASIGRMEGNASTSGDFYGRKLIIEFKITPKEGFLGGNNVPTNEEATISSSKSGITKTFEDEPIVNVPIPGFTVTAVDKNVYLTNTLTLDELTAGAQVITTDNGARIKFGPNEKNYGLKDWQNAFVDIVPESQLVDSDAGKTKPLVDDDTYELRVTISPNGVASSTNGDVAEETTGTGKGSIEVYLPQLTYTDGEAYYGAAVPDATYLDTLKADDIIWKHEGTLSTKVSMIGAAPQDFVFTYQPTADTSLVKDNTVVSLSDIPVSVQTVIIGNSGNLIEKVSFIRNNCSGNDKCPEGLDGKGHFLLHVKSCDLTITKTGGASDETYIFYVVSPENAVENMKMTVRITGNNSITIHDLPVGTYTVTEDENWSWRYFSSWEKENKVTLSSTNPRDSVTCKNTKENDQWLNHLSTVWKNVFGESTGREVSGNE